MAFLCYSYDMAEIDIYILCYCFIIQELGDQGYLQSNQVCIQGDMAEFMRENFGEIMHAVEESVRETLR